MRVADKADIPHAHAVARELVLDHVLVKLKAAHAECFHDLVGAIAGIDHDRIWATDDQEAQCQDTAGPAAIAAEDKKARLQFDVAIVQDLDFKRHVSLPASSKFPADKPAMRLFSERHRAGRHEGVPSRRDGRPPVRDIWSKASRSENWSRTGSGRHRRSPPCRR